jgi:ornithine cyclodeaminase
MVYLTEEDIFQAASIGEVVDAIEESMLIYERGDFLMPDRMQIDSGDNTMLLMPCFIGIGSYKPADREFPRVLYNLLETIYIDTDTDHALQESGDLVVPLKNNWITKEQISTIGKYLKNPQPRTETTFFKSVGMGLFDLCAAKLIYEKAIAKNLGQEISP